MLSGESWTEFLRVDVPVLIENSAPTRLRQLRHVTGNWFFVLAFAARLPVAMNVIGVLTLITLVRGSIAEAGLVSAVFGLAAGFGGPIVGIGADRYGQRKILLVIALAHACLLGCLIVVLYSGFSLAVLLCVAVLAGATVPPAGPLTRARWLSLLGSDTRAGGAGIRVALGYEGMVDEISFVAGPILVGLLATFFNPLAPLVTSVLLVLVFVTAFALHPSAVAAAPKTGKIFTPRAPMRALFTRGVLLPVAGMIAMGGFFGATLSSLTAFMNSTGAGEHTGLVYAALGFTSALAAITVGRLPQSFSLSSRWLVCSVWIMLAAGLLPFLNSVFAFVLVFALVGVAVGANLVTMFTIGSIHSPEGRLASTMTMLTGGLVAAQAVMTALASALAEKLGSSVSFWLVGAIALVGFVAAVEYRRLR